MKLREHCLVRVCAIPRCGKPHVARGWCKRHYDRWRANGDPLVVHKVPAHAFRPGQRPWNAGAGRSVPCEVCGKPTPTKPSRPRRFCSQPCRGAAMRGEGHPRWTGGYEDQNEALRHSTEYAAWRAAVFARDDFTCQGCGARGVRIQADHIESWVARPDLRFDLANGRTLCVPCHMETPSWGRG